MVQDYRLLPTPSTISWKTPSQKGGSMGEKRLENGELEECNIAVVDGCTVDIGLEKLLMALGKKKGRPFPK